MGLKEIEAEIEKLELKDRAALAKWIVESLEELSETEIEALWAEEAERRLDEMKQGQVKEVQANEVLRRSGLLSRETNRISSGRKETGIC